MGNIKVLIDKQTVDTRIKELAKQIEKDYSGKEIVFICILKGSIFFTTELAKNISNSVQISFMKIASYENTTSSGVLRLDLDILEDIQNKDVIIIEDIIDTRRTMNYLLGYLKQKNPNSLKICTLLDKPSRKVFDVEADYVGFKIEDKFVVGYGLDYNQKYRNLPYIGYIE